jgi:hypothetical protein
MNHVRFMISPELCVVQEALTFDIVSSLYGTILPSLISLMMISFPLAR